MAEFPIYTKPFVFDLATDDGTYWIPLAGDKMSGLTAEAHTQMPVKACIIKEVSRFVPVGGNTLGDTISFELFVDGVSAASGFVFSDFSTGIFYATITAENISSDQLVNLRVIIPLGTGVIEINGFRVVLEFT